MRSHCILPIKPEHSDQIRLCSVSCFSAQSASWEPAHVRGQQQRWCEHTWNSRVWNHVRKPWANVLTWNRHVPSTCSGGLPVCVDTGLRVWAIFSPAEERRGSGSITASENGEAIRTRVPRLLPTAATGWRGSCRTSAGNIGAWEAKGEHLCWTAAPTDHMSTRSHPKK